MAAAKKPATKKKVAKTTGTKERGPGRPAGSKNKKQ